MVNFIQTPNLGSHKLTTSKLPKDRRVLQGLLSRKRGPGGDSDAGA
jgi:hypothetical protein